MIKSFALCMLFLTFHKTLLSHEGAQIDQATRYSSHSTNQASSSDSSLPQIHAITIFKIGDPADISLMEAKITYTHAEAERIREFYRQDNQEMQNYFDDYFATYHGKLEKVGILEIDDDEAKNTFSFKISYILREIWQENPEEHDYYFTIFPKHIVETIGFDVNPLSPFPYALDYPIHISEHITLIREEGDWADTDFKNSFDSDEINLSYTNQSEGKKLHFIYLYTTKKDHIPVNRLGEHRKFLAELSDQLINMIRIPVESAEKTWGLENENYLLLGILTMCYGWLIVMLTRKGKKA